MARRILNLVTGERIDEQGLTWLAVPAKINTPPRRQPYPLSWGEQARLFAELPAHLARWHCLPSTLAAAMPRSAD
jgi:hypothetical protein